VCLCVRATVQLNRLCLNNRMPLCRSTPVQAKIGQVQNTKRNVAKLVGLTSSEGFRVIDIIMLCKTMFERAVVFYLATVCVFIIMRECSELKKQ